jgi:hypothetical protein
VGIVKGAVTYYLAVLFVIILSSFQTVNYFDGIFFGEMIVSFVATLVPGILIYGAFLFLVRRTRFRYWFIMLIPAVVLSFNYFVAEKKNIQFTSLDKFRHVALHNSLL